MHAKQIIIIADERLDVKGAVINGKEIKVEAEVLTIEQVLDTVRSEYNSDGISAGITVTWSGAVVPYGSFNHRDGVKQSQVVRFLSSISGESVDVTAKHLIYNIATITASEELKLTADNITYTPIPEGENVDQETRIMMAFSVGSDGKLRGSIAGSHRDGDFVVSGGYFSSFFEGLDMLGSLGDTINPPPLPPADNPTQYSDEDRSKEKHEANHSDNEPENKQEQPAKVKTPAPKPAAPKVPASKPLSALAKAYIKAGLEINQFDISEQEKQSLKKQVFAKLQEFEQASVHNKQALLDSWHKQTLAAKPRQSWWQQAADKLVNWFGVPESEAAVPIAIGTVKVIGMVIGALVLAKAVEWKENRPKVFITPIHEEEPIIYSTPIPKPENSDKGFDVSKNPTKDQGYNSPGYDTDLEGFSIYDGDGNYIFFNEVSKNGAFNEAKADAGIPRTQQPDEVRTSRMEDKWQNPIKDRNGNIIQTKEYIFTQSDGTRIAIQDHSAGHEFGENGVGDQGPHFNIRRLDNNGEVIRNSNVPGTKSHYPFNK